MTDNHHSCRVRIGSADEVLAVVPHLLGFHPDSSLVVLGIGGPHSRVRLAFRYDLPDPADEDLARDIGSHAASVLTRQHLSTAIVIGYGAGRLVTPIVDVSGPALSDAGITIHDILRVEAGRYWSYLCVDPACCPPEGVRFDAAGHPAAATLEAAGLTARPDRAALARTVAAEPRQAEAMAAAVRRALDRAGRLVDESLAANDGGDLLQSLADSGRRSVRKVTAAYRKGGRLTDLDEIAWLGLALTDLRVRDDAWARMDPEFRDAHQRLWTDLVRLLPDEYVPAPASLLAFTAWQSGDGALASVAIERALAADPGYSLALLIGDALHAGLPPSAARLTMTPKQVAASYAHRRRAGGGQRPASVSRRPGTPGSPRRSLSDQERPRRGGPGAGSGSSSSSQRRLG